MNNIVTAIIVNAHNYIKFFLYRIWYTLLILVLHYTGNDYVNNKYYIINAVSKNYVKIPSTWDNAAGYKINDMYVCNSVNNVSLPYLVPLFLCLVK